MKKVWIQEEHSKSKETRKIVGMGLVSHTVQSYLSHSPHCKVPYISGLVEGVRVDSRQDAMVKPQLHII